MTVRAPLVPGRQSPWRAVPAHITRPEYVGKKRPKEWRGSHVQTPETIEKMRVAGRLAAQATELAGEHCKPGVTTDDIDNVDVTAYIGGVHGDTDATFCVGDVGEEARLLVERTHEAMMRGIRAVAPGRPINAIGRVIEAYAKRFSYGVVRDFTGHGIGATFHSGLYIPHYDNPGLDTVMEPGMTFTIEPMIT